MTIWFDRANVVKVESRLSSSTVRKLSEELKNIFLTAPQAQVYRYISFASMPVTGSWHCSAFTISPAPPQAPRPRQFLAPHPYVLEVPFMATTDTIINAQRAQRLKAQYELLLAFFGMDFDTPS